MSVDNLQFIQYYNFMFNYSMSVFHAWSGILQFLCVITISFFLTMLVNKILDIGSTFLSTVPIIIHGWPEKTDIIDNTGDDTKESTK